MNVRNAKRVLLMALLAWCHAATAVVIFDYSGSSTAIPDNNANGVAFAFSYSGPSTAIGSMTVTLNISGGWNGDLYVYVSHGSGFSVLMNRIGRTAGNPDGSASSGMNNVTFSDVGINGDIHSATVAAGTAISGTWVPDARTADPGSALDTSPRSAYLSSFSGLDPNGSWTLFIADASGGFISTLNDFSVDVTPIPEPITGALAVFGVLLAFVRTLRNIRTTRSRRPD
jgi:subtilisin-like proprotein convertase family protein